MGCKFDNMKCADEDKVMGPTSVDEVVLQQHLQVRCEADVCQGNVVAVGGIVHIVADELAFLERLHLSCNPRAVSPKKKYPMHT